MAEAVEIDSEMREKILAGVSRLADAVSPAFGAPRTRHPIGDAPFTLKDLEQDAAAKVLIHGALATADATGDGTAQTILLARRMCAELEAAIGAGCDMAAVKRGIDKAVDAATKSFQTMAQALMSEKVAAAATRIVGCGPAVASAVAEATAKAGRGGVIAIGNAGASVRCEWVPGVQFDRGYASAYFVTDAARDEAVMQDAYILLYDGKLSSAGDLSALLRKVGGGNTSLLIVAEDFEEEALGTAMLHKLAGTARLCAVKAPGFGERRRAMLTDLAILTGGKAIAAGKLGSAGLSDLGRARLIRVDRNTTLIAGGKGAAGTLQRRIADIMQAIYDTNSDYDREKLQERHVMLSKGVVLIHVDDNPETVDAVRDMLNAVAAIVEDGVVVGAGVAHLTAASALAQLQASGDEHAGITLVLSALHEPCAILAANAGVPANKAVEVVKKFGGRWGYNMETRNYEDLERAQVFDAVRTLRVALQNAASLAWVLLTDKRAIGSKLSSERVLNGG